MQLVTLIRRPEADLSRLPVGLDLRAIDVVEGVRAALSVAVLVALNEWLQWPGIMEAALAAWLACLCDQGGPIRRRVPAVLSFTAIGAVITASAGLARNGGIASAVLMGSFGLFCLSFIRIYGQSAMLVGNLLGVVLVLALDQPLPSLSAAGMVAASFVGGGLWATLLTMVVWRIHPYAPARRAVAEVYRQLALLVANMRDLVRADRPPEAAWEAHARAHRRSVREAIEQARATVFDTVRVRGPVSPRAAQGLIRLEAADQLFGALIALSDVLEHTQPWDRKMAGRGLRRLGPLLRNLGRSIATDETGPNPAIARSIGAFSRDTESLPPGQPLRPIFEAMVERLQIAATLSVPANFVPGFAPGAETSSTLERIGRPLRANLGRDSLALRHALRVAIVAAPAIAITLIHYALYQHWLTITLVLTMQPYFATTLTRSLERIGGTVLGGGIAALLGVVCGTPLAITAALFPLAVIALAVRQVSFGMFMMAVTPIVVLLSEIGQPGASEWVLAGMRGLYTVIGGLLALAGCLFLWPSWEPRRLVNEVRSTIEAHARYADAEISYLLGEASQDLVELARRAAGVASNNVEASLSRALQEPRHASRDALQSALVIDAALRRFAGRLSTMQLNPSLRTKLADPVWRSWREWIVQAMQGLASGATDLAPKPLLSADGPAAEVLLRMARQIELIAGARRRIGAGG
ncbi:MAG: FUSC family protein [Acetobacteraceae bacterium]|nr:FUSC family protein [Acetobacteraceae bacterium]